MTAASGAELERMLAATLAANSTAAGGTWDMVRPIRIVPLVLLKPRKNTFDTFEKAKARDALR